MSSGHQVDRARWLDVVLGEQAQDGGLQPQANEAEASTARPEASDAARGDGSAIQSRDTILDSADGQTIQLVAQAATVTLPAAQQAQNAPTIQPSNMPPPYSQLRWDTFSTAERAYFYLIQALLYHRRSSTFPILRPYIQSCIAHFPLPVRLLVKQAMIDYLRSDAFHRRFGIETQQFLDEAAKRTYAKSRLKAYMETLKQMEMSGQIGGLGIEWEWVENAPLS